MLGNLLVLVAICVGLLMAFPGLRKWIRAKNPSLDKFISSNSKDKSDPKDKEEDKKIGKE